MAAVAEGGHPPNSPAWMYASNGSMRETVGFLQMKKLVWKWAPAGYAFKPMPQMMGVERTRHMHVRTGMKKMMLSEFDQQCLSNEQQPCLNHNPRASQVRSVSVIHEN
jgi:hypothetical protein